MRRWMVGLGLVLGLAGCTTMDHRHASHEQKLKDEVECRALAQQGAPPPGTFFRELRAQELLKKCLESRGWTQVASGGQ